MKIVCVSTSTVPSDTANSIQVMKACQGLASLGHEVTLLLPGEGSTAWETLAEQYGLDTQFQVEWLRADPRWKHNDFAWNAVQRAGMLGAKVLYTWTGQSAAFALLVRLPVIYEIHDLPTGRIGPLWFRAFMQRSGRKRLLPITQALLDRLEKRYGAFPKDQVVISPNGVDLEPFSGLPDAPAARSELGLPERPTVMCAGHLYAGRGVELFLSLAKGFPQASFVWVGGNPENVAAFQASTASSALSNVTFTGFVNQRRLPCYLAAADVLLMPYARAIAGSGGGNSADICSPMKMFDYLAAGRTILSSDLPVIHEVLNKSNAVFADPEDLPAWMTSLDRLLADPARRQRMAAQARHDAERYTWHNRAAKALDGF